ncbi:MAG: glycosyltransferase [Planctomycetota bacterium]|nr:glycosyltransferase [Planctomycetota bacterium]
MPPVSSTPSQPSGRTRLTPPLRASGARGRVLVLSGSAGHGHVMAARAVTAALRSRHPLLEVAHVDAVARMWSPYKQLYRSGYERLVDKHPHLWRMLYESSNRAHPALGHLITRAAGGRFVRLVKRLDPDLIVCTHFLAPELLAGPVGKGKIRAPVHVVVTDHDTHLSWNWPGIERYYVASEAVKARLALTFAFPEARIDVTGIPIREAFSQPVDARAVRLRYGLDAERPTVLFLSAGFAAGSMGKSIHGIWRDRRDVQVLAVCGRNERMRRRIERMARPAGAVLHPLGFIQDVPSLMGVADVVVAKSGGLTTSECMAMGKPMVISGSIPGQEERNADAVIEAGAGYRALTPQEVRYRVRQLLEDPDLRAAVARRAQRFGRPGAAGVIADHVAEAALPVESVERPRFHGAI